jgi:hypothetical protein
MPPIKKTKRQVIMHSFFSPSSRRSYSSPPPPRTHHPSPYTLHSTQPLSQTFKHKTLNPKPKTQNPKPYDTPCHHQVTSTRTRQTASCRVFFSHYVGRFPAPRFDVRCIHMDYFNRDLLYAMYIDSRTSQVCVWGVFPPLAWHI